MADMDLIFIILMGALGVVWVLILLVGVLRVRMAIRNMREVSRELDG
jgi:hypothetical protein